ncbi:MAG: SDR family oxidoreductase [Pirellulales bacterium]|nr:SDR family oxidoreductase [Pirellulales bacterium]
MHDSKSTDLANQTAVVTGSSSGIGRAIAIELAAAGADLLIHTATNRDGAEATASDVRNFHRDSHVLAADLADSATVERFADAAWNWRGHVDIWINNAGVDTLTGDAAKWPFEQKLAALWAVDVRATVQLSRIIGQRMKRRGRGVILNIGWDQAETGMAGDSGELFATTKGAVMAFTRSLAKSLAPEVRVNCIAPGWIKTAWGEKASDAWQDRAESESLLRRWGTPEDIALAARFLATPAASFITGQIIPINGGRP